MASLFDLAIPSIPSTSNPATAKSASSTRHQHSFSLDRHHDVDLSGIGAGVLGCAPGGSVRSAKARKNPRKSFLADLSTATAHRPTQLGFDHPHDFSFSDHDSICDDANQQQQQDEEGPETMVDRIRLWRHDALLQHLYSTAEFWGQKLVSITSDQNDIFWLAQTYFYSAHYARAVDLLLSGSPRRLVDRSLACRYLAGQCMVKLQQWSQAMELLGEENPFRTSSVPTDTSTPKESRDNVPNDEGGIKLEASLCHLRGMLHLRLHATQRAKESFMEALSLDVKCYDSFDRLVTGGMMSPEEEWNFVQGLKYKQQTSEDAEFIRLVYTARLTKHHQSLDAQSTAITQLGKQYNLVHDPDIVCAMADVNAARYRWNDAFALTSQILAESPSHPAALSLQIACLHHLPGMKSRLFLLAHELVKNQPESCCSWYAVGIWYFTNKRWSEARTYLSKATLLDGRYAPAWFAFAHSFSMEGEHDQAITAYSTASRLFQGNHLPILFIGMQHLQLSNIHLASEYIQAAMEMREDDPVVLHERGVVAYYQAQYEDAVHYLTRSIELSKLAQMSILELIPTHTNLGHAYRKLGNLQMARNCFQLVLDHEPQQPAALTNMGFILHLGRQYDAAISFYHDALSISGPEALATQLLTLAMEDSTLSSGNVFEFARLDKSAGEVAFRSTAQNETSGESFALKSDLSHNFESSVNRDRDEASMILEESSMDMSEEQSYLATK